jgi:mono/diheme cytochrome c family protein
MPRRSALTVTLAITATLVASACGGGASAQSPATSSAAAQNPATSAPAAATLPPANTPAATAASTPTAAASTPGTSSSLVAKGKVVWQTAGGDGCQSCHGIDGKGSMAKDGTTAPNVRGATEVKLRDALRGGAALMRDIKLTDDEITAVLAYLTFLDQQ